MSQTASSSRLSNSAVNIIGATTAISTNFGLDKIGVTGNSFDISSSSGTVTLGVTGTGNVQLGNATSGTVSLPGTTTFATLNSPAVGTNVTLGGNLTTGTLTLGSTTSTTNLFGTLDVKNIEGPTAGSAMTIGSNVTSGSVSIGNAGGPNTVNIGSVGGAGPTGTINIGTSASTVNVGGVGATAFIGGTVVIGATGSGNVFIGNGATAGVCYVNSVGTNISSYNTNIGNLGNTAVLVNLGFNDAGGPVGTVNIGRGATAVTIGNTAAGFRSAGPITLGSAPATTAHLGWKISGVILTPSTTPISNSITLSISQIDLPIGIWLLVGTYLPNITSTPSSITSAVINFSTSINNVEYGIGYTAFNLVQSTPSASTLSTTSVYNATAATTMYLNCTIAYTGGSITRGTGAYTFLYHATRIG